MEEFVEKKVKDIGEWIAKAVLEGRDVRFAAAKMKRLQDLLDEYHNQNIEYDVKLEEEELPE